MMKMSKKSRFVVPLRSTKSTVCSLIAALAIILLVFDAYYSQLVVSDNGISFDFNKHIARLHNTFFSGMGGNSEDLGKLIDTPACSLPRTQLNPQGLIMWKNYEPYCDFERRIVDIDDTEEILRLTSAGGKRNEGDKCTVVEINRPAAKDTFELGRKFEVKDSLNISDKELLVTKCGRFINFDGHFPLNQEIRSKIEHWKQKREEVLDQDRQQPPINVLFMGFDTVSRSHFHRSLPQTVPLMTQMGFLDFKGYHSVAPYTLENFLAFLMGLTTPKVRSTCAANWSTPFDTCPLIWKDFDLNKFVTMYIEDGPQTFNWGGQSGFMQRPTDYYAHPLFTSVGVYRKEFNARQDENCLSTMNAPHFILDYVTRFVQKFGKLNVPFFSFVWFAYPFHDSTFSLHGFDDKFSSFFQFLNSESSDAKALRENTLIIVNSDHGERNGDFVKMGYEGFIERALPALLIRLPDNLLKMKFKEDAKLNLQQNLAFNTERLTGGFDIHHTLLHLLDLQGLKLLNDVEFQPILPDRQSLLLPVNSQRTCEDINVLTGNCVCNTTISDASTIENPFFTNQLVNFAIDELNALIKRSKYKSVCKVHGKPMLSLLSANIKAKTKLFTDTVLRFLTDLNKAQFEVQLRIFHGESKTKMDRIERRGPFNRLNLYGELSWCVDFVTDEDKRMKEICHCKMEKPKN